MTDGYLEDKRKDIAETDKQIIALLKKRADLATDIGKYKAENGLGVRDTDVERRVIDRYRYLAAENGLDPDRCEEICRLIMRESVEKEKELQEPEKSSEPEEDTSDPEGSARTKKEVLAVGLVSIIVLVVLTAAAALSNGHAGTIVYILAVPIVLIALCFYLGYKDLDASDEPDWTAYVRKRTYLFGGILLILSIVVLALILLKV